MDVEFESLDQSRRAILKAMAAGGTLLLGDSLLPRLASAQTAPIPLGSAQKEINPRVAKIVADTISVDMHNHISYPFVKTPADLKPDPDIDLPGEMKKAGLSTLCYCYCVDAYRPAQPGEYYQYHLESLDYIDRLLTKSHMRRALSLADLKTAHSRKEPMIIQNSEGAQFLEGHIERVEEAYKRGLRHLQFVHQLDDLVAPIGDIQDNNATKFGGLTPFGHQMIKECNRLGIVVDLAHAHYSTLTGALKVAQQPLVVSHTALNSPTGRGTTADWLTPRLVSKEYAEAVKEAGGIVGVWHLYKTLKEYVAEVKEMADVIGVDHVGIGTDSPMAPSPDGRDGTNHMWPDEETGFFYAVAAEMLAQGFHAEEISKIAGGNYCRVFDTVTKGRT